MGGNSGSVLRRVFGRVVFVAALLWLGLLASTPTPSLATAGSRYQTTALANGVSAALVAYTGSTDAPADRLGDLITFNVEPSPGSYATPRFPNGSRTITAPLGGTPCDGDADEGTPTAITKCFARTSILSDTAGAVRYTATNSSNPDNRTSAVITFFTPRVIVGSLRRGDAPSELIVQNAGSSTARGVIEFYTAAGERLPAPHPSFVTVPGARERFTLPSTLPNDFDGVAVVGSDQPILATAVLTRRTGALSAVAAQNGAWLRPLVTNEVLSLPYVSNALESTYNTDITLVNTGTKVACAVMTYSFVPGAGAVGSGGRPPYVDNGPGGDGCGSGFPIPVNGQIRFTPAGGGGSRALPTQTKNCLMAATVAITGGSAAAMVSAYTTDGNAKAAAYEGFVVSASGPGSPSSDLGTDITLPLGLKTPDGYYTQYLFSNPGTTQADLKIVYSGTTGTHTATLSIPPGGVANHSVYSDSVVPIGFVGAAKVTSNVPISAVLFRAKKVNVNSDSDESLYTAVNGVPSANATRTQFLPAIFRRVGKDSSHDGRNSWISVSVQGGGKATLGIRMAGGCTASDAEQVYFSTTTVTGSAVIYQNADTNNGFGASTPSCFDGGATITSDVPIVAIASSIDDRFPGDGEGVYNGSFCDGCVSLPTSPAPALVSYVICATDRECRNGPAPEAIPAGGFAFGFFTVAPIPTDRLFADVYLNGALQTTLSWPDPPYSSLTKFNLGPTGVGPIPARSQVEIRLRSGSVNVGSIFILVRD